MTNTMKKYFEIEKEQRTISKRLGEIGLIPLADLSDEIRAEQLTLRQRAPVVQGELQSAADEQRAEQEKGTTVDAAETELRALAKEANVGDVISAAIEQRMTTGATSEIQQHFKLNSNQVPLSMLRIDRGVEERAAATVPASIGDAVQGEVITPIFATGDGAFLGIERPVVPVGDASFPILSTPPGVRGPFTDSTATTQTDATYVANNLAPERLSASYAYRRSDAARFASLDASLRLALNGGLTEALDKQAISGSDGLLTSTNLGANNVSAVTSFALYLSGLLYGRVDGKYARSPVDVRMIVGQGTFAHASGVYKASETDETGAERLAARSGGLMVSSHVPAVASNKQNALIRLGMERGAAVQPTWEGVTIVVDPYSKASEGEVILHASILSNFQITRASQWSKRQTQHA